MSQKILISAALQDELHHLVDATEISNIREVLNVKFWEGKLNNKEVVIYQTKVSRTNAAYATAVAIKEYGKDNVIMINTGSSGAGTINEKVFSTVISDRLYYREPEVTGYKIGQVPYEPEFFQTDSKLLKIADTLFKNRNDVAIGNYICSEAFMNSRELHDGTVALFENVKSIDMESTAVAQIAHKLNIPFIGFRTISDNIHNEESPLEQFNETIKKVGEKYTELIKEFIAHV